MSIGNMKAANLGRSARSRRFMPTVECIEVEAELARNWPHIGDAEYGSHP
jgi:hypothetical protein